MTDIPVFRMRAEQINKDKFVAIAEHLGVQGDTSR